MSERKAAILQLTERKTKPPHRHTLLQSFMNTRLFHFSIFDKSLHCIPVCHSLCVHLQGQRATPGVV